MAQTKPRTPTEPPVRIDRTVRQICDPDGTPYQAHITSCIWGVDSDPYEKTDGNSVEPLLTGEDYFRQLADAIAGATTSIYMLGWQINWDVMLTPGKRLYDVLKASAEAHPALKIYVLPWAGSMAVKTFVSETLAVLRSLDKRLGGKRIFAVGAEPHAAPSDGLGMFFSHHQKQVVIDEKIAFVGGMDVAYGRRDSATYPLDARTAGTATTPTTDACHTC